MLVFELIFSMFLYKKIIVYCQNIILICFEIYYFCKKYFMDLALIILGIILIILGIGRCFLPVIPGPPLSFAALILLQFTEKKPYTVTELVVFGIATALVTVLDYIIPLWGTKQFGGTKKGVWGSTIGLILGMFFLPPFGIIIGPFLGAFIGELIGGNDTGFALKSAIGSFIGFLAGTFIKVVVSGVITWYFVSALF